MSTFSKLTYHIVFSTKYRQKTITANIRERLYEYLGGIVRGLNGSQLEVGGIEDHVHLLANLPATKSVSNCVRDIKANSSKRLNQLGLLRNKFEWQKGYGAFTVSQSQIPVVRTYIQNQRDHHRSKSFKEEFTELLIRHGIQFEDKYLFESEHFG